MVNAKVWVLKKHFEGFPKTSDFDLGKDRAVKPKGWREYGKLLYARVVDKRMNLDF
uniref:Uncharacterized protein n=1 Tax=Falco tinnunculus TaxID=100819 RepID=A0A8C4U5Y2_FALTI